MYTLTNGAWAPTLNPPTGQTNDHTAAVTMKDSTNGEVFTNWGYTASIGTGLDSCTRSGFVASFQCSKHVTINSDDTIYYRADGTDDSGSYNSAIESFKSYAMVATVNATPDAISVTDSTATLRCTSYTPNVLESTCSAQLQYKRSVDSTWTNAGSPNTTGGYSAVTTYTAAVTGLTSSTAYNVRLVITRTTTNATTTTSSTGSFTTLAGAPTITTVAASSITETTATLNSTLTINSGTGVTVYFKYDTVSPPTANTTSSTAEHGDGSYPIGITGLTGNTLYYFQAYTAFATPTGSPVSGSILSFTTDTTPDAAALAEDHMTIFDFDAPYGTQTSFAFTAASPSASSSNVFYTGAAVWAATAAESLVLTFDGSTWALCTVTNPDGRSANAATQISASSPYYEITLTAAELSFERVYVFLHDSGAAARDVLLRIRTKQRLGQVFVDATNLGSNNVAVTYTGVGTQPGLKAVGGSTSLTDIGGAMNCLRRGTAQSATGTTVVLDANASATDDYYNGALLLITGGTNGSGQFRIINDYTGSSKTCAVSTWTTTPTGTITFAILPGADSWSALDVGELSAYPPTTMGGILRFLFQRFGYKRTQTASTFTMFKADNSTTIASGSVSDSSGTETSAKLS